MYTDSPADTLNYMIAGFVVIFGGLLVYAASLYFRFRIVKREVERLMHDREQ